MDVTLQVFRSRAMPRGCYLHRGFYPKNLETMDVVGFDGTNLFERQKIFRVDPYRHV